MEALQDLLREFSWTRNNIEKAHKLSVMADDVIDQCDKKPAEDNHGNRYYRTCKKQIYGVNHEPGGPEGICL